MAQTPAKNPPSAQPETGRPRWAGPLAALLIFSVVTYLLRRELEHFHVRDILAHLHSIPPLALIEGLVLTALSYFALSLYDVMGLRYLHKRVAFSRTLIVSFIANAFGHNLGFAAFTGAAFRLRLYASSHLTAPGVATITGFTSITTALGLIVLAAGSFLLYPDFAAAALHTHRNWSYLIGTGLVAAVMAYFAWTSSPRMRIEIRGWLLRPPGAVLGATQIVLGTLDLSCSCAVLWVLLPPDSQVGFVPFAGAYAIAVAAGLVSHVPGGLGVFETVIVLAVPNVATDALLGSLLAYRSIYYLVPLLCASLMFGAEELWAQRARLEQARRHASAFISPVVPSVVGALTFLSGAVLLFSGATPSLTSRLAPLGRLLPLAIVELSHLAGSVIGLALLILARALFRRIRAAYHITFWLLVAGAVTQILKGVDYEEAIFLGIVLVMLSLGKRSFYRPASILEQWFTPTWAVSVVGVIVAITWVGFLAYRNVAYSNDLWWTFAFDANAPRMLRASLFVSILAAAYLLLNLMRPPRHPDREIVMPELAHIQRVVASSNSTLSNAALTGDKHLLFSDSGESFIMYQVQGRSWIALGDPVGPKGEAEELVWRLRERSDRHGGRVAFYQTSADCLALYVDLGLAAMKIGEEARVPLVDFSLEGSLRAELRTAKRRAERDKASFEVVPRERVQDLMPALRSISDAWLKDKATAEKGFSVGSFSERYLRNFPVALVRRDGEPVAFANLWPAAALEDLSVDLMRFSPDAPPGTMDYLFIELMLWARAQGYQWFSLGMAPLAGLERHPLAPAWHRIGNFIFRHGEHFYNFDGLRRYKAKFHPVWEPKYLAAPGGVALPLILVDVSLLIAGGLKELFVK
ncbi:MAG TPA: bifunctional lysylphosphatidylglycerol flippase/synthetase MprF [Steroidobacteraceae bacterium]|nr:bifunctional lysylphosphatidylglycerol flippase/synthetase MprF [Steroidobacteraceae bacterium]